MSIVVKNVTKYYGSQKALDNVSFTAESGKITAFLGPNGAGKSTMMKILTGFIPASSGSAFVDGVDVANNSLKARQLIGYLPEHNPLYLDMYVKEYLEFSASVYKIKGKKGTIVKEIISKTGLEIEQHKKIGALSKGYRQRVGLAQALIHDPKILILDEPTTGLDPNQIIDIRELIKEVGGKKTVLLSTHIMQEVEAICNNVIIIKQGQIVVDDSTGNIHGKSQDNQQNLVVEFNKAFDVENIKQIKGVIDVVELPDNKIVVTSNAENDIREDIFKHAVSEGLTILSMQLHEKSMEDIFREYTK